MTWKFAKTMCRCEKNWKKSLETELYKKSVKKLKKSHV